MRRLVLAAFAAAHLLCYAAPPLHASSGEALTLDGALALARAQAPDLEAARLRVDEVRGRLSGASILLRENPVLEAVTGPAASGRSRGAVELTLSQGFEIGGRRGARIAGARADVERAVAEGENAARLLVGAVGAAFLRTLHAQESRRLTASAEDLAAETLRITERRFQAGDVPVLHANVARAGLARARSESRSAEAALEAARGELAAWLGVEISALPAVGGDLRERGRFEAAAADTGPGERADVRALGAELRQAEAERRLGRALAWPEVGLEVRYERPEEGPGSVLGGLTLSLPLFDRGQGTRVEAEARARRLRVEVEASRRRAAVEWATAVAAYRRRVEAVVEQEQAMPLVEENEALARRSYEVGQIGLAELIVVFGETLDARVEYLQRLLDAAVAGIELEVAGGGVR